MDLGLAARRVREPRDVARHDGRLVDVDVGRHGPRNGHDAGRGRRRRAIAPEGRGRGAGSGIGRACAGWSWQWEWNATLACGTCIWIWNWSWGWTGEPTESSAQAAGNGDVGNGPAGQVNTVRADAEATAVAEAGQAASQGGFGTGMQYAGQLIEVAQTAEADATAVQSGVDSVSWGDAMSQANVVTSAAAATLETTVAPGRRAGPARERPRDSRPVERPADRRRSGRPRGRRGIAARRRAHPIGSARCVRARRRRRRRGRRAGFRAGRDRRRRLALAVGGPARARRADR